MKVNKTEQVFNLYDTNGRRNDVINAYKIYTEILEEIYEESKSGVWGRYPNESTQFRFYELAIERSPEIFKKHPKYDKFIEAMANPQIRAEFEKRDISHLKKDSKLEKLYDDLDNAIEGRARHYSSNLVKIGLADEQRKVTEIGNAWIRGKRLHRSRFENLLPIDDTNLIFLRQLLKLRVYTAEGDRYYSPMLMAIFILLKYKRVNEDLFITLVQMLNPYLPVKELNLLVEQFINGNSQRLKREYIPLDLNNIDKEPMPMSQEVFEEYFSNRKSEEAIKIYREFYELLVKFNSERTENNFKELMDLFSNRTKKDKINKAFGFGKDVFVLEGNAQNDISEFMKLNDKSDILMNDDLNKKLYLQFQSSKRHDAIEEYGDVTKRVMKVTGIISFKNGIAELAQRDLWIRFFDKINVEDLIFGNSTSEEYEKYEKLLDSPFLNHLTIEEIFNYDGESIDKTISEIKDDLKLSTEEEIREEVLNKTSKAFIQYINQNYPKEKTLEILRLFSDRSNDSEIQKIVAPNTDIPTIFEYIVGIAWYHISSKKFDLFNSFNLSMSADFEPETHAGGGSGDIVIDYGNYILMIEATLMNKYAQKRGEWEPVLRHATNLTIENSSKEVTTLFIADELDQNTINIWRAVATVPLQSSRESDKFANKVTIMPIKNKELAEMLEQDIDDVKLLNSIKESFNQLLTDFNMEWRNDILDNI